MPIGTVDPNQVKDTMNKSIYSAGINPFTKDFRMLQLFPDNEPFIFRIMPMNYDEALGKCNEFAVLAPTHEHLGNGGKENSLCPARLYTQKTGVLACPCCIEYNTNPNSLRSKIKPNMYMNVVLLSQHYHPKTKTIIPQVKENGQFIVYTIRVTKTQVFDAIAKHYSKKSAIIKDPVNLQTGCSIAISVSKQGDYYKYETQVLEAQVGDLLAPMSAGNPTPWLDVNDIKDLRYIIRYVPTQEAMQAMLEGLPVNDAMELGGKINIFTGEKTSASGELSQKIEERRAIARTAAMNAAAAQQQNAQQQRPPATGFGSPSQTGFGQPNQGFVPQQPAAPAVPSFGTYTTSPAQTGFGVPNQPAPAQTGFGQPAPQQPATPAAPAQLPINNAPTTSGLPNASEFEMVDMDELQ